MTSSKLSLFSYKSMWPPLNGYANYEFLSLPFDGDESLGDWASLISAIIILFNCLIITSSTGLVADKSNL